MPDLLLTPVSHADAVAFLKNKPAVAREVFDRLLPDLQARAFAIAGVDNMSVVQAIRDRIAELPQGANWDDVKADIATKISPYLGEGEEGASAATRRAELLLRTQGYQAYAVCKEEVMQRQSAAFPYAEYVTAGDHGVRDSHAALNGLILPVDSPFWDTHTPPWEWGCRCEKIPRTAADVGRISAEESRRPPEARRVVSGPRLTQLESSDRLTTTGAGDMPRFVSTKPGGSYTFNPRTLQLDTVALQERYDPETWRTFEKWAGVQKLDDGRTVKEWLNEPKPDRPAVTKTEEPAAKAVPALPRNPPTRESKAWADTHMQPRAKGIAEADLTEARDYQSDGFTSINRRLRDQSTISSAARARMAALDRAVDASTVPAPVTVFRGIPASVVADIPEGGTLIDRAFMSTSLSQRSAKTFSEGAILELRVPAGQKALYMDELAAGMGHEVELLLPRGTKLRIVSKIKTASGWHVIATIAP